MSQLLLVRHGQARLFTDDYDRLSPLGVAQARALAEHWLEWGLALDGIYYGTLTRQQSTAQTVRDAYVASGVNWPPEATLAGLDEYPAEELVKELAAHLRDRDQEIARHAAAFESAGDDAGRYRHFHRLLAATLERWIRGDTQGAELSMTWEDWSGGVVTALRDIMSSADSGQRLAVFTSGGVIGTIVQHVLEAPPAKAADLNWRIHNASVTGITFSGPRTSLDSFNGTRHLTETQLTYR